MSAPATTRAEIAGAQPLALLDAVNHQEGSIVSRVLIKREKGNITLFAFDEGQSLSEHTAPFDALVQALEGRAEITVSGKSMTVNAGEIVLLPAQEPHAVKAASRFKMLLTMIRS